MKSSVAFALAAAKLVASHATFQSFVIDGKDQGQHFAVQTPSNGNNPILDPTSSSLVCNGGKATTDFVTVAAGSKLTFQWHHNDPATASGDNDEPIAASHKGPIMVYVAKASTSGTGAVWQKIYEDGLNGGKWGVDNFIASKGAITITVPDLEAGEYLFRPEIIALHEGNRQGAAQFYNGCGQVKVTGGSTPLPASGYDMTKVYTATDPGVLFDIYAGKTTYPIPGPPVWVPGSSGTKPSASAPAASATATGAASAAPAPASSYAASPSKPAVSSAPAVPTSAVSTPKPTSATPPKATGGYGAGYPTKPQSSAAPIASAVATPVASAAPAPSSSAPASGTLPQTFTIEQFIAWLKTTTGSKARRHARSFAV